MMNAPSTFTLPDGLRVLVLTTSSDVCYAGIALAAGTRDELPSESGMAHLVEHMTFKGTERLSSRQILNRIEGLGGELNAYTAKEETIYYAAFLRDHLRRALPLLPEIVFASTYPQDELEKEREVVIDEIESYNDSPAELIFDDFEALLFPNHPLGRSILGHADCLRSYSSRDLHAFTQRCYDPQNALLFVMGNASREEVERIVKRGRPDYRRPTNSRPTPNPSRQGGESSGLQGESIAPVLPSSTGEVGGGSSSLSLFTYHKDTHQAHVMLGTQAYAFQDERYLGLSLLSNLLGGPAMNSRLSLALRERYGLVYTVESNLTGYTDTGVWSVYFGCDHDDVQRCLRLVRKELDRLTAQPLAQRTLDAARRQLKGQIGVSAANAENLALSMAKRYLHTGSVQTPEEICARLDSLTPEGLHAIACEIFDPQRLTTLVYE